MVIVFRGTSGSGKSMLSSLLRATDFHAERRIEMTPALAYIEQLWNSIIKKEHVLHYCSADSFFMVNGEYKYDKKMQGAAQQACLREFVSAVARKGPGLAENVIIVDNTNTTIAEVAPYAALANAYAHELQVITILTDPTTSWRRNQHNVPFATVVQQSLRLHASIVDWPSWYPQQIFPG